MVSLERAVTADEELAREVQQELDHYRRLNYLELPEIGVTARNGRFTLSGNVAIRAHADAIGEQAARVAGAHSVTNAIVDDASLSLEVWKALAAEPAFTGVARRIRVVLGAVYIDWAERDAGREWLASWVLHDMPGMRSLTQGPWACDEISCPPNSR